MDTQIPRWHVLTVKKGCEKKVTKALQNLGFEALLPVRKTYRIWSDRRKRIDDPLFRGYAFVCVSEARRAEVFGADANIRAYLRHEGRPCVLRPGEVELLHQWSAGLEATETASYGQLRPGTLVEIVEGPFSGYKGMVRDVDTDRRLRLELLFVNSLKMIAVEDTVVKVL